jgi:hypothetical protein
MLPVWRDHQPRVAACSRCGSRVNTWQQARGRIYCLSCREMCRQASTRRANQRARLTRLPLNEKARGAKNVAAAAPSGLYLRPQYAASPIAIRADPGQKGITVTSFQHSEDVAPINVAGPGIAAMLN